LSSRWRRWSLEWFAGALCGACTGTDHARVDVSTQLGEFSIEASFRPARAVTGVFGRLGRRQTSLINMIAGLLRPDRGIIVIDGEVLDGNSRNLRIPPHRRRIGYVFQERGCFHTSMCAKSRLRARMNRLVMIPRSGARHRSARHRRPAGCRPGQLSGGSASALALGRALLAQRDCCCWMSRWGRWMRSAR